MPEKEKLANEKQLLGIYVTENPISTILKDFQDASLPKISEIISKDANTSVKFVAVISKIKSIRTKKGNSQMAFVTLEDSSGQMEGVIFPRGYETYSTLLTENRPVYIEGKISVREDQKSILIDLVSEKLSENTKRYDFVIEVPKNTSQTQLMNLNNLLKKNPIVLPSGKNIPIPYGVRYNTDLQRQIDSILDKSP
jgi:DNA polymerase-3 subunit alpha